MRLFRSLLVVFIVLLLGSCAQSSLWPQSSSTLSVRSQPSGADVYLMGRKVGQTPLSLDSQAVFPLSYDPELEHLYGRIELRKTGCTPMRLPVSVTHMEKGILATLNCSRFAPSPQNRRPAEERLRELQQLHEAGLIDDAEYQRLRQRVLDSL